MPFFSAKLQAVSAAAQHQRLRYPSLTKSSRLVRHPFPRRQGSIKGKGVTMISKSLSMTAALACLAAGPAVAQSAQCAPRDTVVQRLAEAYGETRQSMGLGANNAVVEVFASATSGSWTIIVTGPGGITCLIAAGHAFETMADSLPAPGNDA